jgi:hypothetical protein
VFHLKNSLVQPLWRVFTGLLSKPTTYASKSAMQKWLAWRFQYSTSGKKLKETTSTGDVTDYVAM